jgi:hypothetical protein
MRCREGLPLLSRDRQQPRSTAVVGAAVVVAGAVVVAAVVFVVMFEGRGWRKRVASGTP